MGIMDKYELHTHSYLALRKAVGIIGILLPLVLSIGTNLVGDVSGLRPSISLYYGTSMGDVLVGALCAVGLFLLFYAGYEPIDNWAGNVAGTFAIGTALFPAVVGPYRVEGFPGVAGFPPWVRTAHLICAALFFITLAFFSLFLFTRTAGDAPPTRQKQIRNRIYVVCGVVIVLALLVIVVYSALVPLAERSSLVFFTEAIALLAFAVSWLTKGEAIMADKT